MGKLFFITIASCGFFIVAGAWQLAEGLNELRLAFASSSWPTAKGVVTESLLEKDEGGDCYLGPVPKAWIVYKFKAEGAERSGTRTSFGWQNTCVSKSQESVQRLYPEGKALEVRYKPGKPDLCVLEAGAGRQCLFQPLFGFAFLAAGTIFAVLTLKAGARKSAEPLEKASNESP